jgi:tRNA threonylcarbamoyladenosine biosynthesis protein TsaE
MIKFVCKTLADTRNAAEYFAGSAKAGRCFALFGDLGYGKTAFAGYFIRSLNKSVQDVVSPTFSIVQIYDSDVAEIWHVDCHRLKSEEEFRELGLDEAFQRCITIVEWPEIIENFLPTDTVKIKFSVEGSVRELTVID